MDGPGGQAGAAADRVEAVVVEAEAGDPAADREGDAGLGRAAEREVADPAGDPDRDDGPGRGQVEVRVADSAADLEPRKLAGREVGLEAREPAADLQRPLDRRMEDDLDVAALASERREQPGSERGRA